MHRKKTYVTMLCSVALSLSLLCCGGKLVVKTGDSINSYNTAVTSSLTELDLKYEVTTNDRCSNKNVNAIKTTTRENFFFLARRPKVIEKQKMNMMDCLHNVMDRNLTKNPDDFNENFLTYEFPASSSCFDYQHTIAAQIKVNYDFVKLKVGEVDNIEIFAVIPNKYTDIVLIENFLHENIARTMQLFKSENPDCSHLISKASEYAITGHRIRHVHRLKSSVANLHEICKNLVLQNNRFTIKGPATLLYLLNQYMRCYAKSMLPNYIKEALDEIERMNSIWFDFDIRQRTNDMGQNVTIFVEIKANALLYDLDLADLYKVVSLYVNDKYMDRETLFDKLITENSKLMPQGNCEEYGNTQNSTVTQPPSIQVSTGTDDIDD